MRTQLLTISLTFFAVTPSLHSQNPGVTFEHIDLTVPSALSSVGRIIQDEIGFIWIATNDGLVRYDGNSCLTFRHDPEDSSSISGNYVRTPMIDRDGIMWVGTDGNGLNRFERETGTFTRFQNDPANPKSLSNNYVRAIVEDSNGYVWIGTWNGLNRFNKQTGEFTVFRHDPNDAWSLSSNDIKHLFLDRNRALWIGTESGLNRYDGQTNRFHVFRNDPLHPDRLTNDVKGICEDAAGFLWIATSGGGVCKFDKDRQQFVSFLKHDPRNPNSLSNDQATWVIVDNSGILWAGTVDGLNRYDEKTGRIAVFKNDPGNPSSLSSNRIDAIYQDKGGSLWVGTIVGLNKFDGRLKRFRLFQNEPGNPNSLSRSHILSVFEDKSGILWIGTWGGGLNKYDRRTGRFSSYRHIPGNPRSIGSDVIDGLFEDEQGILWVGTEDDGLNRLDRNRNTFRSYPPSRQNKAFSDQVSPAFIDKTGAFWVATPEGPLLFDRGKGTFKDWHDANEWTRQISVELGQPMLQDREGKLWFRLAKGGLCRLTPGTTDVVLFVHDPADSNTIASNRINYVLEDRSGLFWMATHQGLDSFDPVLGRWRHFTVKHGLDDDRTRSVLEDDAGRLWISTRKGITRFDRVGEKFKSFGTHDGLQEGEFSSNTCFKSKRGELFFGGDNGLNAFFPDSIKEISLPPPIVITSFKKFYREFRLPKDITVTKEIVLAYNDDVFSFDFAALSYIHPERNQYAYALSGFDRGWSIPGPRHTATYTHLDPGEYVFMVKGSNDEGVWNTAGASVKVIIEPPVWGTWWFRTLAWLIGALFIAATIRSIELKKYRRRLRVLEQQQALDRERLRISRDMHDEVGATLTEIAILSELARRKIHDPGEIDTQVQKISERSRQVTESIGQIVWAINPKNDRMENLTSYLRQYTSQYFKASGIEACCEFPEGVPDLHLSAEVRRNLFLTVKEALHNVMKHSGATRVRVELVFRSGRIEITVEDNGRGFSPERLTGSGNGLENMRRRMTDISGTFEVQTSEGAGTKTRLTVMVPLQDL